MALFRIAFPSELWDTIIDHLHDDSATLLRCALVCRTWVPASRCHAFEAVALSQKSGFRAARLNAFFASPQGTIVPAVRALDVPDSLAPIQICNHHTGAVQVKPLLALTPRVTRLQHVRSLTLSDLPWTLLRALDSVEHLTLTRLCAGACLLDITEALPRLSHLTLEAVAATPVRAAPYMYADAETARTHLATLTIRHSPLGLLGWLAYGPTVHTLIIDTLSARDIPRSRCVSSRPRRYPRRPRSHVLREHSRSVPPVFPAESS
jgi:hypothetical protein